MWLIGDTLQLVWRFLRATLGRLVVWMGCVWMRWITRRPWWSP